MNSSTKPNPLFWIASVVALIWNISGVMAYLSQAYMDEAAFQNLPLEDQAYFMNVPAWVTAAFALAVFSGTLGSIALLMRKKVAYFIFIISLIAVLAQNVYSFFIQQDIVISGNRMIVPILIIIISFLLVYFSKAQTKIGVLK